MSTPDQRRSWRPRLKARRWDTWVSRLARFGLAAKGAVYLLIGAFAAEAALSEQGRVFGALGALQQVMTVLFGQAMLGLAVAGLGAYVVWRLLQALGWDRPCDARPASVRRRVGHGLNGLAYTGLAWGGAELLTGAPVKAQELVFDYWAARLIEHPLGLALVMFAGLSIAGIGVKVAIGGINASFRRHLDTDAMSDAALTSVVVIGRAGRLARAAIYITIGVLLLQGGLSRAPKSVVGLRGALELFSEQRFGSLLLGCLAVGLIAYGGSLLLEAWKYDPAWS